MRTSRVGAGDLARRWRLFLTPGETRRPRVLRDLDRALRRREAARARRPAGEDDGFVRAVVDPGCLAVHAAIRGGSGSLAPGIAGRPDELVRRAIARGPAALGPGEREELMADPDRLLRLHEAVWSAPSARARAWGRVGAS